MPGVLGVFADPKEAKAPEPSPNAEAAPVVGDGTFVVEVEIALKGLALPWDDVSPPKRLAEKVRGSSGFVPSLPTLELKLVKESLLELKHPLEYALVKFRSTYFERRCQRLSIDGSLQG